MNELAAPNLGEEQEVTATPSEEMGGERSPGALRSRRTALVARILADASLDPESYIENFTAGRGAE